MLRAAECGAIDFQKVYFLKKGYIICIIKEYSFSTSADSTTS